MPKLVGMERKATVILTCDVWAAGVQATWNVDTEATTVELVHRKLSGPLPKVAHAYPLTYPVSRITALHASHRISCAPMTPICSEDATIWPVECPLTHASALCPLPLPG
jgi:hypothetical protein